MGNLTNKIGAIVGTWQGMVTLVVGILGLLGLILNFIVEVRTGEMKVTNERIVGLLQDKYSHLRSNFVTLTKSSLNIKEVHDTKILDSITCGQALPCADYLRIIEQLREETGKFGQEGPVGDSADLDFSYLAARVLIYEAIFTGGVTHNGKAIQRWLDTHKDIAKKHSPDHLRDNYKLQGLYELQMVHKFDENETRHRRDQYNKALRSYELAITASREHNDTQHVWAPALSAIISIYEEMYISLNEEDFKVKLVQRVLREVSALEPLSNDLDNVGPTLGFLNLAEAYIMQRDYTSALRTLDSMSIWYSGKEEKIRRLEEQRDERKVYNAILGLELYCTMRNVLDDTSAVSDNVLRDFSDRIDARNLRRYDYTKDLLETAEFLLSIRVNCRRNGRAASSLYDGLKQDIADKQRQWVRPGFSRPRILLQQLASEVLHDKLPGLPCK